MKLIELETSDRLGSMPSTAQRGLLKALVLVGSACEDHASKEQYWNRVLVPLKEKFAQIIQGPDFKQVYNDEKIRQAIIRYLESFIGKLQVEIYMIENKDLSHDPFFII